MAGLGLWTVVCQLLLVQEPKTASSLMASLGKEKHNFVLFFSFIFTWNTFHCVSSFSNIQTSSHQLFCNKT